jgi:hypothetical protein
MEKKTTGQELLAALVKKPRRRLTKEGEAILALVRPTTEPSNKLSSLAAQEELWKLRAWAQQVSFDFGSALEMALDKDWNFYLQHYLVLCDVRQLTQVCRALQGRVLLLSRHKTGCRVVSRLAEASRAPQGCPGSCAAYALLLELQGHLFDLCCHRFGNYVVQKLLECLPNFPMLIETLTGCIEVASAGACGGRHLAVLVRAAELGLLTESQAAKLCGRPDFDAIVAKLTTRGRVLLQLRGDGGGVVADEDEDVRREAAAAVVAAQMDLVLSGLLEEGDGAVDKKKRKIAPRWADYEVEKDGEGSDGGGGSLAQEIWPTTTTWAAAASEWPVYSAPSLFLGYYFFDESCLPQVEPWSLPVAASVVPAREATLSWHLDSYVRDELKRGVAVKQLEWRLFEGSSYALVLSRPCHDGAGADGFRIAVKRRRDCWRGPLLAVHFGNRILEHDFGAEHLCVVGSAQLPEAALVVSLKVIE